MAVPATCANLGPGFDALGLALALEDEVTAEVTGAGVQVEVTGEGADEVPRDAGHLIVRAMLRGFAALGCGEPPGIRLTCHNRIPHARGLGSSSAAIVAGLVLARALVMPDGGRTAAGGAPPGRNSTSGGFDDAAVLRLAAEMEGHPDNVAPCLLGGLTIAWSGPGGARAVRLEPSPKLRPVVFIPPEQGLTAAARAVLPELVPHADAAFNAGRAALAVHALTTDPSLLMEATEDRLHQGYRAPGMPATAALLDDLRKAGIPACVSGAGPSVIAFRSGASADRAPLPAPKGWFVRDMAPSASGARILDAGGQA